MSDRFAKTPEPPYYAVIFTSQRTEADDGYGAMASAMHALALAQPGCLGAHHVVGRAGPGFGEWDHAHTHHMHCLFHAGLLPMGVQMLTRPPGTARACGSGRCPWPWR